MKKLLTIINDEKPEDEDNGVPEQIEILHAENAFSHELFKKIKGKYTVLAESDVTCDPSPDFFTALEKNGADILEFEGSLCVRSALLKNVAPKFCADKSVAELFAVFAASSVTKIDLSPFAFAGKNKTEYSAEEKNILICALDEFAKVKSKLDKPVYNLAFDLLCRRLIYFYLRALLALHDGKIQAEEIKDFDKKLKENVVLHVTFTKRFPLNILKLREKNFKINFLTANKIKALLK